MLEAARLYANKLNSKCGIDILDEKLSLPRDIHNAGGWFGFVVGFKFCYELMRIMREEEKADS